MRNLIRLTLAGALILMAVATAFPTVAAEHCDPRLPECRHEQGEKKDHCFWTRTAAPANPATFGASPGAQLLKLSCPNHILVKVDYGYKNCRFPVGSLECTQDDPIVQDLGQTPTSGTKCGWENQWVVYAPNINVFTFYFKAATYKDENCDQRPDDWNANAVDPAGQNTCYWINYYGPKPWDNPQGLHWPYTAPPFSPTPDGKLDYCDLQIYETQWRGWN